MFLFKRYYFITGYLNTTQNFVKLQCIYLYGLYVWMVMWRDSICYRTMNIHPTHATNNVLHDFSHGSVGQSHVGLCIIPISTILKKKINILPLTKVCKNEIWRHSHWHSFIQILDIVFQKCVGPEKNKLSNLFGRSGASENILTQMKEEHRERPNIISSSARVVSSHHPSNSSVWSKM